MLVATAGLSASGKTTWARTVVAVDPGRWVRANRDTIRAELFAGHVDYSDGQEAKVTLVQHGRIHTALAAGMSVIVDDTNTSRSRLDPLKAIADQHGVPFRVRLFELDVDEAIRRQAYRGPDEVWVPPHVIRRQAAELAQLDLSGLELADA